MRSALIGFVVVIALVVVGAVFLAAAPLSPKVQKVEQVIPDDQLPR